VKRASTRSRQRAPSAPSRSFEVKYGGDVVKAKAGINWLRAEVTHGVATGRAAAVLTGNMMGGLDRADILKRTSAVRFLSSRSKDELEKAGEALNFDPPKAPKTRWSQFADLIVNATTKETIADLSTKLATGFTPEKPCGA